MMLPLLLFSLLDAADPSDWITRAGGTVTRDSAGRVTAVDLRSSWVTDSDLPLLVQLSHLTSLDLSLTRITDRGLQQLKGADGITELNLHYAEQITDEGIASIKGWKGLKKLNVRGTRVTDTTLEHIAGISGLQSLDAGYAQVTDVGLDRLTSLANLKELSIGGNKLTDAGLQALRYLSNLERLDLSGTQRTDSGLWNISLTEFGVDAIATLSNLRELRLNSMPVSARSLQKLKSLTKLERLDLQLCARIGDDAVPVLASWPSLRAIDLKGTKVTANGVAELRQSRPAARILHGPWEGPRMPARGE